MSGRSQNVTEYRRRRDASRDPWAERARRDEQDREETRRRHEQLAGQQQRAPTNEPDDGRDGGRESDRDESQ